MSSALTPTVVDFGSADGATMSILHRRLHAARSTGIEYAQELVDSADQLPADCKLVRGDIAHANLLIEPGTADLVTALAILEHLEDPGCLLQQAFRALRPGGLLIATAPAGTWDAISGAVGLHKEEHHEHQLNREFFDALARRAGLQPRLYKRFMLAPVAFLPYLGVRVSPTTALAIDEGVRRLRLCDWLFVNQLFVAQRPV